MREVNKTLEEIRAQGLYRTLRCISSAQEVEVDMDGRRVINFSGNNCLGLATHPALLEAARKGLDKYGFGSGASRLISGNMEPHERLEQELAAFTGFESALYFTSGYQANTGAIPALAGKGHLILSDALNHASLIDGIRLSRAQCRVYPHNDVQALDQALRDTPSGQPVLVVTEALFSMEGDRAPLKAIMELKKVRPFLLYIDEAHSLGAIGPGGRGGAAEAGCMDGVDIFLGTLGKAFGMSGAFIAGRKAVKDLLVNRARTFIYTTASPPALACAASAALGIIKEAGSLRQRLRENGLIFRALVRDITGETPLGEDHIVPVPVRGAKKVMKASETFFDLGIFCQGSRPPTVPAGRCRLRFSLSALHTNEHLKKAAEALRRVVRTLGD
ncbi:MAG: 8-amino-7-oxononanoate synthase [Planctomycetota bacterium]